MLFGFAAYDLIVLPGSNCLGFNTGANDCYGAAMPANWSGNTHHVVAVLSNNGPAGNKLYIDGVAQVLTQRLNTTGARVVGTALNLSGWASGAGYNLAGATMDEVAVYNKELAPAQVAAHYKAGGGLAGGLVMAAIPLANGWTNYGAGYATAGYALSADGVVVLRGLVNPGTTTVIGTLPAGYRPSKQLVFQSTAVDAPTRIDIDTAGNIVVAGSIAAGTWRSLDGINFLPAGGRSMLPLTFQGGWSNYGAPWADLVAAKDYNRRVHVQGLVNVGASYANGTVFSALAPGDGPSEPYHLPTLGSAGFNFINILTGGNITAKGVAATWQSVQTMTYDSADPVWNQLVMANGWVRYDTTWSTPRFTKGLDGIVVVTGLVRSGTTGTVIGTLPPGYRPTARLIMNAVANGASARVDIAANGDIIAMAGTSAAWTSLDNISFVAEQ